jgi:4'-phosphopantetheinyl transferase
MTGLIYCINDRPLNRLLLDNLTERLPERAKMRCTSFVRWQDRQAHLLGQLLSITALGMLGVAAKCEDIQKDINGRPYFKSGLDFNVSHSGQYVICAYSDEGRIGADVQHIDRSLDISLFQKIFLPHEFQSINQSSNPYETFYNYWTIKEAAIKADGRGLRIGLLKVAVEKACVSVEEMTYNYKTLNIHSDYGAAIVSRQLSDRQIKPVHISIQKLTRIPM